MIERSTCVSAAKLTIVSIWCCSIAALTAAAFGGLCLLLVPILGHSGIALANTLAFTAEAYAGHPEVLCFGALLWLLFIGTVVTTALVFWTQKFWVYSEATAEGGVS